MATIDQIIGSPLNWDDFLQRTKEHDRKHSEKRPELPKKDDPSCRECFSDDPDLGKEE